jgi:hypothetical protein
MNTYRTNATLAGVLYIIGTLAGVVSMVVSQPVRDAPDPLAGAAANTNQVSVTALCILLMGLSLALVSLVVYPVLKRHSEALALGYVVFRGGIETVAYFVTAITWLLLPALGQLSMQAGATGVAASGFPALGALLLKAGEISGLAGVPFFCLGALMFYGVLYRTRLVPRWLSGWGLAAVVPYLAAAFLATFALLDRTSSTGVLLQLPMAVQEMVLAVWLIVKGFNVQAVVPEAAKPATNELLAAA